MSPHADPDELRRRYPVLDFFEYRHLPQPLQDVSRVMTVTAWEMVQTLPYSAETSVGLRKLLEAKDAFVRAALGMDDGRDS